MMEQNLFHYLKWIMRTFIGLGMIYFLNATQAKDCPQGLIFSPELNRCLVAKEATELISKSKKCQDEDCYYDHGVDALNKAAKDMQKKVFIDILNGKKLTSMGNIALGGGALMASAHLLMKAKKEGLTCKAPSVYAMMAGGAALGLGEAYANFKHSQEIKKLKIELAEAIQLSKKQMKGHLEFQKEALEFLERSEENNLNTAKLKETLYAIAASAFSAAAVSSLWEHRQYISKKKSYSYNLTMFNASKANSEFQKQTSLALENMKKNIQAMSAMECYQYDVLQKCRGLQRYQQQKKLFLNQMSSISPLNISKNLPNVGSDDDLAEKLYDSCVKEYSNAQQDPPQKRNDNENSRNSETTFSSDMVKSIHEILWDLMFKPLYAQENPENILPVVVIKGKDERITKKQKPLEVQSIKDPNSDAEKERLSDENDTLLQQHLPCRPKQECFKKFNKLTKFLSTPKKRFILSSMITGWSALMLQQARSAKKNAEVNMSSVEKIIKGFEVTSSIFSTCSEEDKLNSQKPKCFCFVDAKSLNPSRRLQPACQNYWKNSLDRQQGLISQVGNKGIKIKACVFESGQLDRFCQCHKTKSCMKTYSSQLLNSLPSSLQVMSSNGLKAVDRINNGAFDSAQIDQASLLKSGARSLEATTQILKKTNLSPLDRQRLASQIESTVKDSVRDFAPKLYASSSYHKLKKGGSPMDLLKENFNKTTSSSNSNDDSNSSKSFKSLRKNHFNHYDNLGDQPKLGGHFDLKIEDSSNSLEIETQNIMNEKLDYRKQDISKKNGFIFDSISHRYQQSAFKKLQLENQ